MENQGHSHRDSSPRPKDHQNRQRTGSHAREQPGNHGSNHGKGEHKQVAAASGDRSSSPLKQENASRDKIVQIIQRGLSVAVEFSPELFETLLGSLERKRKQVEEQLIDCDDKIQRCKDMKKGAEEDKANILRSHKMLERRLKRNDDAQQFIRMAHETMRIVESSEKRYRGLDNFGVDPGSGFDELFKKAKEDIQGISDAYEPTGNTKK